MGKYSLFVQSMQYNIQKNFVSKIPVSLSLHILNMAIYSSKFNTSKTVPQMLQMTDNLLNEDS